MRPTRAINQTKPAAKAKDRPAAGPAVQKEAMQPNSVWQSLALTTHGCVQAKLAVNQPGDRYEQEADRIADRVMRMPANRREDDDHILTSTAPTMTQRKCASCEEEEEKKLQRKSANNVDTPPPAPSAVDQVLNSAGQPLSPETRSFMEPRFGQKFGHVRVHSDARAAESARAVNARAFTVGSNIVFGANQFNTSSDAGKRLLAHELAHTIQQHGGGLKMVQRDGPTPIDVLLQGVAQLPPVRVEDFCQPWASLEEARRANRIAVQNFLPALTSQFGAEVGALWREYLSRPHGASLARRVFSDPAHRITRAFAQSQIIRTRQSNLMPLVEDWFRRTCPALPPNFPMGFTAAQIFAAAELDFPINFNIPTEIPGHIAGGVGSSDAGPDTRRMEGSIVFFRSTGADGRTTGVRVRTDLQFIVRDAIDFCPGDFGAGLELMLTVPLSRLERSGEVWPGEPLAYDVPFEVRFTGDPISTDLSAGAVQTCDPHARPPTPPTTPPPSPTPPAEEPSRWSIFRKPAEGAHEESGPTNVNDTWRALALGPNSIQAKFTVSEPGDPYEEEADQVADQVMRVPASPSVQRKCDTCEQEELKISAAPPGISRAPAEPEQDIHDELIEQYRRENGLPPRGIDPNTGQQVGPTNSEIRFGGLLEAWLRGFQPRSVPAPTRAPNILPRGQTSVVAACANATNRGACLQHKTYVTNIMPQAITNIRNVSSPYSTAIADLYAATLPAAQAAAEPIPWGSPNARFGRSSPAAAPGPVTVTFGGTNFTFNRFEVSLIQDSRGSAANGQAMGIGTPTAFIFLNEMSQDALSYNLEGIEATMIHEMMHIFMAVVEARNAARAPGTPIVDRSLDRSSYAGVQTSLVNALLPFVRQIRQLPSFTGSPPHGTELSNATETAESFLSEMIGRVEAAIFVRQRAGQAFTAADLRTLPQFYRAAAYWSPTPPAAQELTAYIQTNQAAIDTAIEPLIRQAGERYLNLR